MILTEKKQIVPQPEEEVAQKEKDLPEETEETKTYGPRVSFQHQINANKVKNI